MKWRSRRSRKPPEWGAYKDKGRLNSLPFLISSDHAVLEVKHGFDAICPWLIRETGNGAEEIP